MSYSGHLLGESYPSTEMQLIHATPPAEWNEILNKAVYISHSANILGKSMNPTILPSAMSKQ